MNIPMKYEDVVAQLDAALSREAALREELESIKASVDGYDSPEHAAQVADEMGHQCDALQQRLTVAEQRVGVMEKALTRIARPHDCGCLPCTGDCTSKLSLEITVDGMRETAELALKGLCETCHDQGEIFVSKGKFEYGMESEPDPIYKPCPVCSKAALKPAAEGEGS